MSILKKKLEEAGMASTEPTGDANNGNAAGSAAPAGAPSNENPAGQPAGAPAGQPAGQPAAGEDDIPEDKLLKELQKRGITATSLSELNKPAPANAPAKTEDELRAEREARQDRIAAFGLSKGKVTKNLLDKYAIDSKKDPIDLAYEIFRTNRLAELKEAKVPKEGIPTEEDLLNEFNEYNHLTYDETDPKRIRREKELQAQADAYLKETYKPVYDLDKEFEDHETGIQTRAGFSTKVETAVTKIPTELVLSVPDVSDKSGKTMLSYKYKPSQQTIDAIKAKYGSDDMYNALGKGKLSVEDLSTTFLNEVKLMEFDRILSEVAHSHAAAEVDKGQRGRRNIIDTPGSEGGNAPAQSSPVMKKLLDQNKDILQQN